MDNKNLKVYKISEKFRLWLTISGTIIIAGTFSLFFSGLQLNIDFTGGTNLTLQFEEPTSTGKIRSILDEFNLGNSNIQQTGNKQENIFNIRTRELENQERVAIINELSNRLNKVEVLEVDSIGPIIGEELKQKSLLIIITVLGLLLVYITLRFEFWSGLATLFALLHDAMITIGFIALLQLEVDISVVVAILTILGYSINDTIVLFDRIRENKKTLKLPFKQIANISISQTLPRSINTSITVLIAILALIIFGGTTIKTFAIVLFIGIATGTYSSIFIAAPLLVNLKKQKESK